MEKPVAVDAGKLEALPKKTMYPQPFAALMDKREKMVLGDLFGLRSFGVNRTKLKPGSLSALGHSHTVQDEFIYILEGEPVLVTDAGETQLKPGMCAGFNGGSGNGHQLVNKTERDVIYLEIGDRLPGDAVLYPDDDLMAVSDGVNKW